MVVDQLAQKEIARLQGIVSELLALAKEARTDAVNELDSHVESTTNPDGEFMEDEGREIAEEMQGFIERLDTGINRAEGL